MEHADLDLLETAPPYHLQSLIRPRQLSPETREQDNASDLTGSPTINDIAARLFAPAAIAAAITAASDLEQRILRELVSCGGRANSRDLALYLVKSHALDIPGESLPLSDPDIIAYPTAHPHGPYEQALHRLLSKGLLFWGKQTNFSGRDYTNGVYDGVLVVPHAVQKNVRAQLIAPGASAPFSNTPVSLENPVTLSFEAIDEGMRDFQRALYRYWSSAAAARDGLPLVSSGLLARSALRQIIDTLGAEIPLEQIRSEMDVPRLLFMRLLLLQSDSMRVRTAGGASGAVAHSAAYFARPLPERVRFSTHAWLEGSFWNELAYLPNVVARPGPPPLEAAHPETIHARRTVIDLLLRETPGEWLDAGAFIARAKLRAPHLLFPRQYGSRADRYTAGSNPYGWDFRLRHGWLTHREGWHMVEGGFIRAVLFGPMRWLGLIETHQEKQITQFRASALLSLLISGSPPLREDIPWGKLIVQPNFDIVALAPVSETTLVKLDRFAEQVQVEHIAQYRLSKASITRAIQQGMHVEDILRELQETSDPGIDIPQNVRYSLTEWERQARRVELWRNAILIEVDDPALLDDLIAQETASVGEQFIALTVTPPTTEADDAAGEFLMPDTPIRRISPFMALVPSARLPYVQRALWQRDYLPALTPAPDETAGAVSRPPQWRLRDDGLQLPLYAVTDIYLASVLAPFTDLDEQTGQRAITPVSLQRALQNGGTLPDILRFLQAYCEGGIPPSLLIRLKVWGGGYGEQSAIRVEDMPMLHLSEEALRDIQADDEILALLDHPVSPEGRLVRVPRLHLDLLIAFLRERGFEIL